MRKICFVITSQIHYARSKLILKSVSENKNLKLQIAVAASAILPQYGNVLSSMEKDGFKADAKIIMTLAGDSPVSMAKTTGIGVTEFATAFDNLDPDIVIIRGDRYEVLAGAIAAAYMNIPVAHIEGGDLSGTIDESVRHAVTKLSHIHFSTSSESKRRIIQMGECPDNVFDVGCPEIEVLDKYDTEITSADINKEGVGGTISIDNPFIMVMFHPVTTEKNNLKKTNSVLKAIKALDFPTIWFWPNVDANTDEVAKAIRIFRENEDDSKIRFLKYLSAEKFISLLKKTSCMIGNSSSGIKECSYLGIPAVNIGSRQRGRMQGPNVLDTGNDLSAIKSAIEYQLKNGPYKKSNIYFKKDCASNIASILEDISIEPQKEFYDYRGD